MGILRVYNDLFEATGKQMISNVAIVRVKQLYLFPRPEISAELDKYPAAREVTRCQKEPMNQGALFQMRHPRNPRRAGRDHFVLTVGHGSALPYTPLYLTGDDLTLEDIKQFRMVLPNAAKHCNG